MHDFKIVYQPNPELGYEKRRFYISWNRLWYYIGYENANKALERAYDSGLDKYRVKLRKFGIVDFYSN